MEEAGAETAGDMEGEGGEAGELVFNESESGMESGAESGGSEGSESEALPDFSEEETLNEAMEGFEEAMESAAAEASQGGQAGGFPQAGDAGGGQADNDNAQEGSGDPAGEYAGSSGAEAAGGSGDMTDAEQVAILDEQLNRGAGEFDDLILREREHIRRTAKNGPGGGEEPSEEPGGGYGEGGTGAGGEFSVPPMAGGGGGGQGGPGPLPRESYDADIPEQTAVYAPPADIPSGTDDDVVARQLREAAMREPDPQLREKLWEEYRKYKGID
ncbi:MAG: hypothetical protein ABJ308_08610 [Halieaceae bacterium]